MAPRAPRQLRRLLGITGCIVAVGVAACASQAPALADTSATDGGASTSLTDALDSTLASTVRAHMPQALRDRVVAPSEVGTGNEPWAVLPRSVDGRVRLGATADAARTSRVGWRMLDASSARRIDLARGAAYMGDEWDLLQSVDADRLREYIVVREHQGVHTWRWQLYTARAGMQPHLTRDGRVALGDGWFVEPPKLLDAALAPLDQHVRWHLRGSVLELTFDDSDLALPYVIDPDATKPVVSFVQWSESAAGAYYNPANDISKLWFNPSLPGSATATVSANDPDSGIAQVDWPTPPTGWSPAGGPDTSAVSSAGLIGTYWDNSQANTYPGTNFTGTSFSRIDSNVDFSWGAGTPYAALGADTFSIRWVGKLVAPETGTYYFQTRSDDGVRLWVNGTEMATRWDDHGATNYSSCGGISLVTGAKYDIMMEFYENGGAAEARLRWLKPSDALSGSYQIPSASGCTVSSPPPRNHATAWTGTGSTTFPAVPASVLETGGGTYTRAFTWGSGASGGTVNVTADHGDPNPPAALTSDPAPFTFQDDSTAPTLSSGSVDIQTPGWGSTANNRIDFPAVGAFSDTGSSASGVGTIYRTLQRREGTPNGAGGCTPGVGAWIDIVAVPAGTNFYNNNAYSNVPTANTCWEYRLQVTDEVGNALNLIASGFKGWDNTNPNGSVTSIAEGANPQYQKVVGANLIYVNTLYSGDFTVTAAPTDGESGPAQVRFNPTTGNTNWTPTASNTIGDPGPYEQVYAWTAGASNPDWETMRFYDYANRPYDNPAAYRIRADTAGPAGGSLAYWTPAWQNTLSVPVTMGAVMTDALSGVASYQLQRDEAPWNSGACDPYPGTYATNIGAPVLGDPPPAISPLNDTTVADGYCYRYRVAATDHVGNTTYLQPTQSVMVDDTDPTATLDPMPSVGSGTIPVGGTVGDTMSGLTNPAANVSVRIEDLSNPGVYTTIYTDTSITSGSWGAYNWNTSALNGNYRVHVDATDRAGNTATDVATWDLLLDNTAPTMTFLGFTEGTNPDCQYVDPLDTTQAWVRTDSTPTACSGDIIAAFSPSDPDSGIASITTPSGLTGWTPSSATVIPDPGPWTQTYAWVNGANDFNTRNATATSNAGKVSANVPFTIVRDNAAPIGGSITYTTGWHTSAPIVISVTGNFTDGLSGVYHQQLLRDGVPRTAANNCNGSEAWPGTYATIVAETTAGDSNQTLPATINDTTAVTGMCYRYRLVAVDNVGNDNGTNPTPGVVRTDFIAPIATIDGATPTSPFANTVTLVGTYDDGPVDPNSLVSQVTLRWLNLDDNVTTGTIGNAARAAGNWSRAWNTLSPLVPDGNYRIFVDVYDNAGNVVMGAATRDVMVDNSPPTINLVAYTEGSAPSCQYWSGLPSLNFYFSNAAAGGCVPAVHDDFNVEVTADDLPGGLAHVTFPAPNNTTFPPAQPPINDSNYHASIAARTPFDDATAPYEVDFLYHPGTGNPALRQVTAVGNSGKTTNLDTVFLNDAAAPTGAGPYDPPGTASAPSWWSNQDPSVAFDISSMTDPNIGAYPGSGVRTNGQVILRHSTVSPNCTGGWQVTWTQVGAVGEASPFVDTTTSENECYQYRVAVYDNVNNPAYVQDLTQRVRIDKTKPTGSFNAPLPMIAPNFVKGTSVSLSGLAADTGGSGVASIEVRLGAGPATACTATVAPSWSCTWDTTTAPNGPTTLVMVLTDNAGNVFDTLTQSVVVDNEKPTGTLVLTAGANPQWQHVVAGPTPRIYINTDEASGDFTAEVTPFTDAVSGPGSASFPALGTNWTPAAGAVNAPGPYTRTYAWTGPGAANPGAQSVTLIDAAGNDNLPTGLPFEVMSDVTDPTGGSIAYDGGPTSTPSVTFAQGTDADAGVKTWSIERRETTVTGPNTCDTGGWSTWTSQATDPASSPWTDGTVALNFCYQYQLVVTDNVGNTVTYADPEGDTVSIEPAGIVVTETGTTDVTEGGATDTYTVRLRTKPTADVIITIGTPDGEVSTSGPTLTFTTANWNVDQPVTVTAVDDNVDEVPDLHTGQITHTAASADTAYNGLTGADVLANVTDNDVSGITVSPDSTSVAVAEAGTTTDTYTVVLDTKPAADVTITLTTPDGQVTATSSLTFTASDWSTPKTVTITAVDDDVDEADPHSGLVKHAVTSGDPLYAALSMADVTASVSDDDTAGVTVTPTAGLTLDEGNVGVTASYTVVLDSQPIDDVVINVAGDADATVSTPMLTFNALNWNTPQPVVMTVVDDLIVEGPHTATATHLATSGLDTNYNGIAVSPVVADVTDNDVPGIEVTPAGPLAATEGGTGASYQIRLKSEPTADVVFSFATGSQIDPIASITFTNANWNSFQTVNVTATDDAVDEDTPHPGTIVHTVTSADTNYGGWILADMQVDITDNDTAGFVIDELGGVEVDEASVATTDTFTVALASEPTAPITVTLAPDAQVTTGGPTITFNAGNWNTPQIVTVAAVDDAVDEAEPHNGVITITAAGDAKYGALAAQTVTATVHDNDTASVIVSPGTLALDEANPTGADYTIVLGSQPAADVTVTISPDSQVATATAPLTFTSTNWSTPQTVHVTAVDDALVEVSPHPGQLTHSITSSDPIYAAIVPAPKDADITDNDVPGVNINDLGGVHVAEGGMTDTYEVVLNAQPAGDVTVTLTADSQVTVDSPTLIFTNANWNVARTVTVTAVDDPVQEATPHLGKVTHAVSSADPLWASITTAPDVNVDVDDNDIAAIVVTDSQPYALDEDTPTATVSYDVVLATQPTSDVTITLTVPSDLQSDKTSLTFKSTDWNVPQTVTVNAIDDAITEAPVHTRLITHAVASGDLYYGVLTMPDEQFDVTDNDIPGITVSKTSLAATEGGATDTFDVVLDTQPTADVSIDLTGTQVGFDIDPIVFTTANWNTPQTITVTAVDDAIDEASPHAGLVELDVSSADGVYDLWPLADIPVDVTDNDTAGVTITPGTGTPLNVAEAGATSATYDVVLDTEPTADVTIAVTTPDGQTSVDKPALNFTTTNWNVPQTVTVTAIDDAIDEIDPHDAAVKHAASSSDANYGASLVIDDQPVKVADDDTAHVTVTPTTGLSLDEAAVGTTASFTVVLDTVPAADTTITIGTSDGQTSADKPTLLFTAANWNAPQTVTLTVVDDAIDEANPHPGNVEVGVAAGGDPAYVALDPDDVNLTIADNDSAGVSIVESAASTDVDEGSVTDTYDVVLLSQPTADVTITITGGPQASVDQPSLIFTAANWNTVQTVTVSGTPDALVEGPHTQTFTHTSSSADTNYGPALLIPSVVANITDDDVAGVTISKSTVDVDEDGTTDTYDVVLDAEPTADVTVNVTPDPQVTVDQPTLTFNAGNWNTPQTITVTAVDDLITEPSPHTGTIVHSTASADSNFNTLPVNSVTANITDNDDPGVTVTPTSISVAEGGSTATFDVVLDSIPGADVTVNFTEGGQVLPIAPITFTPGTWNTPQTIIVTADDDFVAEGPHSTQITIDTASAAPAYNTGMLTITPVDVSITDNDFAGILLAPSSGLAGSEGGPNVTYDMSLTSEPTDTVTITLAGDADGAPTTTTYTFTPATWSTPQPVSVAIVQDMIAEGPHTTTVTGTIAAGTDAVYGALTVPTQTIDITDDDNAGVTFTPVLPGPLAIAEGGATATYDVVLDTEPTGDVTIDISSLGGQATVDKPTLTFTSGNWNTAQTVTVTANDDAVDEPDPHTDKLTHVAGGADPIYAALTLGDMDLSITDNDTPGVFINETLPDTSVAEGGLTDTVDVVLGSEPTADVTVTLSSTQVTLSQTSLTFNATNWNVPQTITVTATDDAVAEGLHTGTIDALTGSADPSYIGLTAPQVTVQITDNDTAGVVVTQPASVDLDEDTPASGQTYQVHLSSEPTGPVTVTILPDAQVSAAPTTLSFTPMDWMTDQPVTITPIDDAVAETSPHNGVVSHDTSSSDPNYGTGVLTIDTVTFDIADNDTPGISISQTTGFDVTEGGATATYDIVLLSQPTADVTLAPTSTQLEWSVPSITFTALNWNTPQTVTLQAIDDQVDEPDPHPGTLDMTITSMDGGYTALTPATVDAQIHDNDTSDLVVTPATGLVVDEDGLLPAATYTLTLTSIPSAPVTVALTPDAQVTTSASTVTLDSSNWNTGVTVDVLAVDDAIAETPTHPGTVAHAMTSADTNFNGETGPVETVDVTDNDTAGVTITPSGADTTVAEDGSIVDTYDVVLTSEPTADVTVAITPDTQVSTTETSLIFNASNWNVPQTVHVQAVDDFLIEGPHTGTITHAATSSDSFYSGITIANEVANVLDDDTAGVVVTPDGGSFDIAEGGTTDGLTITLTAEPVAPVIINLTPDAQATVSQTSVTLDSSNWNTGVLVTVTAVDDGFIEASPHPANIALAVDGSSDPNFTSVTIPDAVANVTDNDVAGVAVDDLGGIEVDEADVATTDTFEVKLTASPAAGQSVDVAVANVPGQVVVSPTPLTFDDTNWNVPQPVTVTVVDDAVDEAEPHTSPISFTTSSADSNFNSLTVASVDATIHDNDDAGIVTDVTSVAISEAGPTSSIVKVQLKSQPLGTVDVAVTFDAAQVGASPTTLTFNSTNWNVDQDVTITAVDDAIDETDPHSSTVTLTASDTGGLDPQYAALAPVDVTANINDNDTSDVVFTPAGGTQVDEATATTTMKWDVVLATMPSGNVTVQAVPDAQIEIVGLDTLTFTAANWNVPQQIEIKAHDDGIDETSPHNGLLSFVMGGADPIYAALTPASITVDVLDDDTAGVTVTQTPSPQLLAEDGSLPSAVYDVVLDSEPLSDVTITLAPDAQVEIDGGATTLTFTPANWNVVQSVTVKAVDDAVTETSPHTGTITHTSDSLDPAYSLVAALPIASTTFDITDDDVPSFHFDPAAPAPSVDEANVATTASYDLYMDTVPNGPVTVNFAATSGQVSVSPTSYTFTPVNYATPVAVTVTVIDDNLVEGPHADLITHVVDPSSDPGYVGTTIPDVPVSVADNDIASLIAAPVTDLDLDESAVGTTKTFTLVLGAEPTGNVDVNVGTADGQTVVDKPMVTFLPGDWNVPQTVTVTVVDDAITEASPHDGHVTFTTSSSDLPFNGMTTADLVAQITDNDTPGFTIVDSPDMTMDEADVAGTERTMSIVLDSVPPTPVTVNLVPDAQLGLQTMPSLTFTSANWNVPQSIVLRAVDDAAVEGSPHPGVLKLVVDPSSDPLYTPLTITDRTFDIADNDTAGISFTPATPGPLSISEDGATTATYDVVLTAQPLTDVTVAIASPDGQASVDKPLLTFTNADWNVPQTVTVTGVQDAVAEGSPHAGTLTHTMGGDAAFASLTPGNMDLDIADDDVAGVKIVQPGAPAPQPLDEAGVLPAATYTVELTSEPTADVTVAVTADTQVLASPSTLNFTAADWNVPQTVTVTAVDDAITESSPHAGAITHDTTSTDPSYATGTLTIDGAAFDITDNDSPSFTITPLNPATGVDEGNLPAVATYDVSIGTTPTGTVTVDLTSGGDIVVSPPTLTFDSTNASTPQTVTVAAFDDHIIEGPESDAVVHAVHSTTDPAYEGFAIPNVPVPVADDDVAGVTIDTAGGLSVAEAGQTTDTFTVVLDAEPASDVTVDVNFDSAQLEAPAPAPLTFTAADWNVPQTVTVKPVDDAISEGPHTSTLQFTTSSADTAFNSLTVPDASVDIADDDIADVVVTDPADMTMDEADQVGTERVLDVVLATQPVGIVTVTATNNGQVQFPAMPVLTFDSSNWNVPQQLRVQPVNDNVAEASPHDGIVSFAVAGPSDPGYGALTLASHTFQIADDDAALAAIDCLGGPTWTVDGAGRLQMAEDTAAPEHAVTCQVQITTDAAQDVVVTPTVTPGSSITVSPASVTIPAGSQGPATLTFTATDDAIAQGLHAAKITWDVTSTDPIYDAMTIADTDVDIADNDVAGVVVSPSGPLTLAEGGASATATVALTSEPTADVTVTLLPDAQVGATPATLTFTAANWNVPQTVTLTAVDDSIDEPDPQVGLVAFSFASTDAAYAAVTATPISVTITDNDTAQVIVTRTDGGNAVAEGGATDRISLQLATVPMSDVTVTLTGDAQVVPSPTTLTFTPTNWNASQDVTLTAVQDQVVEGEHQGNVTFALNSTDVSYIAGSAATPLAEPVTITDDDVAGITIVESDGKTLLTEAGQTDTYTVVLQAAPTADVVVSTDGGSQVTTEPKSLTFTPANWNVPQTVTATAVQDSIDEPDPHLGEIKHSIATTAPGWAGANLASVTASITDDDTAEIIVGQTGGATKVVEGAASGDTITFRLSSQPASDVTIVGTGDDQVKVGDENIVLTPTNWRTPQQLTVTAIDDEEIEGDHEGAVTFKVSSEDPSYKLAAVSTIIVAVGDNDVDNGTDDFGDDDGNSTKRTPRTAVPSATKRHSSSTGSGSHRTGAGEGRTKEGRTRLPEGLGTGAGAPKKGIKTGTQTSGEVVAAKDESDTKKQDGPIARALDWMSNNWKLWVPLLLVGAAGLGTLAYVLRGDPAQAAAKAAKGVGSSAAGKAAAKKGSDMHLHRLRGGRKKDDDDEEEDGAGKKGKGGPRKPRR